MGNQLIATSHTGRIGVWNAVTKHWQVRVLAAPFLGSRLSGQGRVPLCPPHLGRASEPSRGQSLGVC